MSSMNTNSKTADGFISIILFLNTNLCYFIVMWLTPEVFKIQSISLRFLCNFCSFVVKCNEVNESFLDFHRVTLNLNKYVNFLLMFHVRIVCCHVKYDTIVRDTGASFSKISVELFSATRIFYIWKYYRCTVLVTSLAFKVSFFIWSL
jgi:hypothetical protein